MSFEDTYTKQDEIKDVSAGRPHVVLLGAGASKASFPNGDKNNNPLPLMNELVEVVNLKPLFDAYSIKITSDNFEEVFSDLYEKDKELPLIYKVKDIIHQYFSSLELPDTPTIYDYLVLSLREKDVIATFNWDPLLWNAAKRNHKVIKLPHLIFLHGNVSIGYCNKCSIKGEYNYRCTKCGNFYEVSNLLYPVKQKDYSNDLSIQKEWKTLKNALEKAYIFTVFGYSAPKTDIEAMNLLNEAWGSSAGRSLEQAEFIHKPGEEEENVISPWKEFIHSHHKQTTDTFFNSLIGNHPRRTCEAMWAEKMDIKFIDGNPVPINLTLKQLQDWFIQFREYE